MEKILDKLVIFTGCAFVSFMQEVTVSRVTVLFLCMILACLSEYLENSLASNLLFAIYLALAFFFPEFLWFLPVLFYDLAFERRYKWIILSGVGLAIRWSAGGYAGAFAKDLVWGAVMAVIFGILAIYMALRTATVLNLRQAYRTQRDNSREEELWLKEKNKDLLEKQDYEVRLATLRERNRIAREIHDHVGHMLSRSILQTAALQTISKEEKVKEQLSALSGTLNQAMDNIRESVHDLHDDSLQLDTAVSKMLAGYGNYMVEYRYEIRSEMSRELKYCFLSVIREALSNVAKHSDADALHIVIQEFQDFYQLLFQDNGSSRKEAGGGRGIGLQNMRDRVEAFGGSMNIRFDQGFRIFLSIPKKKKGE